MGAVWETSLAQYLLIFVGYHEKKISSETSSFLPLIYHRYVDDTFALFSDENSSNQFLERLNQIPFLEFTVEKECDEKLPFLDVLIEKSEDRFLTSVYRKPTFSGTYQKWSSFVPLNRKLNLISMLTHRALCICSKQKLSDELQKIRTILQSNGYPSSVIESRIRSKMSELSDTKNFGPKKKPVYLKVPYMGVEAEKMMKAVRDSVKNTFYSVNFRAVFTTQNVLPAAKKDVLPIHSNSMIIYQFKCKRCDSVYIGRCYRRLTDRISEHVPSTIRRNAANKSIKEFTNTETGIEEMLKYYRLRSKPKEIVQPAGNILPKVSKSSIGSHLLENPACAEVYDSSCFTVLSRGRSRFHVDVLEGLYINENKPILCRQKEFVYAIKLFQK